MDPKQTETIQCEEEKKKFEAKKIESEINREKEIKRLKEA